MLPVAEETSTKRCSGQNLDFGYRKLFRERLAIMPDDKLISLYADVAELADALDLGSSVFDVGVQVPSSAPQKREYH